MFKRRDFLKAMGILGGTVFLKKAEAFSDTIKTGQQRPFPPQNETDLYHVHGTSPEKLTAALLEMQGGLDRLIDKNDIVVLKVNSQWWYQGMTNTDVLAAFIQQVLDMPGFDGEIIIADNHQAGTPDARAWTTDKRNGRFNYNELIEYFQQKGHKNVTKYHWHPAGPNPSPLQFDGSGNAIRRDVSEGDGYIWDESLFYECPHGNRTVLAWPVFTSAYSGTRVDLKNGAWKEGEFTGQPVKLINFSAINHHSGYAGITASIKNFMGVVDMSCGYPGPTPAGTFNTHHVGASWLFRQLAPYKDVLKKIPGFYAVYLHPDVFRFRYTGGVLGRYMREVRRADLNIITAIRIGWGARIETDKASETNALIASTDPVALDYWGAKHLLLKATVEAGAGEQLRQLNDPDNADGPFHSFLQECRRELGGTIDERLIKVQ